MVKAQAVQKQVKENSKRLDKAHAQTKQVINTLDEAKLMANGQLAKLRRMWANEDARQKYEKRNLAPIREREKSRCKAENGGVTVFSAVALDMDEEMDDKTCINKNRDVLLTAFCNFRKGFDAVLQRSGLKDGKHYWPNICCKSNNDSEDSCADPTGSIPREQIVPFALAQGGKVTYTNLYGEVVDVLKQNGYLHKGMLKILDE